MQIFGYGEDALTLWALKTKLSAILSHKDIQDKTPISDCVIFYRPSFGRQSKEGSSIFGEFDAIVASKENVYLIESKWDNLAEITKEEYALRNEQTLRHRVFSWYLTHWTNEYGGKWEFFVNVNQENFDFKKEGKVIVKGETLLARNLETVLTKLHNQCASINPDKIKNVLLYFHKTRDTPPTKTNSQFIIIPIDYGKYIEGNFIAIT
jgi:hypothetical protein